MRLLKRLPSGGYALVPPSDDLPPYAILSHTWIEGQEVAYDELVADTGTERPGYDKIRFCGNQAAADGLEYFWVDTCCINKSTSEELSAAINSMFRWYQGASKCYVYLSDVSVSEEVADAEAFPAAWQDAFRRSRWFTRGWTLQELLAPTSVEFFCKQGKRLGSRTSLEQEIHEITKIPIAALRGERLLEFSVEARMSWVASRMTMLKEDKVYCLFGIFSVFLPLLYGEGEAHAMLRLEEEIHKRHGDRSVCSSLPFLRNEHFVGRTDQLHTLRHRLLVRSVHRRMTIYGLGGCGKSALALEFAYRALAERTRDIVFWVPAISRESFELAYRDIATSLRIPERNEKKADMKRLVKEALSAESLGSWLMVVDNADEPTILSAPVDGDPKSAPLDQYLPLSPQGAVLFTTRDRRAATTLTPDSVLELSDMSQSEARDLLARRTNKKAFLNDSAAVSQLLSMLACLPLAIVQAVAFINQNNTSISEYVALFQHADAQTELFSEQFEGPNRYRELDSTIANTWHVSFNKIREKYPIAAEYLSFIACIDYDNIPQSLLPSLGSIIQQKTALGTLTGYAFLTERQQSEQGVGEEKSYDMHPLVHLASVRWLIRCGERMTWVAKAVTRLEKLVPHGGHERRDLWTRYLSHASHAAVIKDVELQPAMASLLDRVGQCRTSLGQYSAAETAHRQAIEIRTKLFGSEDAGTLTSTSHLAEVLEKRGKYEEAETMTAQTLALREKVLGTEHVDTLKSMSNLASVINMQGNYMEADEMNRQTLVRKEKVLGCKHADTLTTKSNLARVLDRRGMYDEAEAMNKEVLRQREEVLGSRHSDTFISLSNLAGVISRQGRLDQAEVMNKEVLSLRREVIGPEHPETLTSMNNLALVLDRQGQYEEAVPLLKQALALKEKVLGLEHPDTLSGMSNLARVLGHQRKFAESEAFGKRTLALKMELRGPKHPSTLMSMSNLMEVLGHQRKYAEAEAMGRRALAGRLEVLGPNHPDTLASISDLELISRTHGR